MESDLEALLEMDFCTKPPNFGVEANMEAPTGDALSSRYQRCKNKHIIGSNHLSRQYGSTSHITTSPMISCQTRRNLSCPDTLPHILGDPSHCERPPDLLDLQYLLSR
jgi:hypothetical protein